MFKGRGMTFLGKLYKNLFLSLVGVVMTFLLLESALRVYLHYYPDRAARLFLEPKPAATMELIASDGQTSITQPDKNDDNDKYIFHPYLYYKNLPDQHAADYNINSLGLRGEEVSREKSPGVFRVIVTGGSSAFGMGATEDSTTWAYILQQELNACNSFPGGVEVLNAGVIGYITAQELIYLQLELLDFSPDLVIAFDGYNDFLSSVGSSKGCTKPWPPQYDPNYPSFFDDLSSMLEEHAREKDTTISSQIWSLLVSMATRSYIGKFFYRRIESLKGSDSEIFSKERPAEVSVDAAKPMKDGLKMNADCVAVAIDNYKKNLQKMAWLVNGRNVHFLIALQPELFFKKEWSPEEREIAKDNNLSWYGPAIRHVYPQMAKAAEEITKENQMVSFLNLTGVFGNRSEDVFTDECHLNDLGNEIVAQLLSDHICRHNAHPR